MTILILLLLIAALWDLWRGKVPNQLILLGLFLGTGRLLLSREIVQIRAYLPGIVLPPLLFFPLFQTGILGAGDIKLFSLLGCFLPARDAFQCIAAAFFIAAIHSLILLLWRKNLRKRMEYAFFYLYSCFCRKGLRPYYPEGGEGDKMRKESGIKFTVSILISAVFVTGGVI